MFNKKASTGTTLTWFPGFLLVVFILILFAVLTGMLAVGNKLPSGEGLNQIKIENGIGINYETQENLIYILNYKFGNKILAERIVEDVSLGKDEVILEERDKILELLKGFSGEKGEFFFRISSESGENYVFLKHNYGSLQDIFGNDEYRRVRLILYLGNEKINVDLYMEVKNE